MRHLDRGTVEREEAGGAALGHPRAPHPLVFRAQQPVRLRERVQILQATYQRATHPLSEVLSNSSHKR